MKTNPTTSLSQVPDLNSLTPDGWPLLGFPLSQERTGRSVPIVIRRSVLAAVYKHGSSRLDVEVCGVLVGNVYRDSQGPFVYIESAIRGVHAGSQMAQVTFTADTWAHIHATMDRQYPASRIMGWYHTHPGFGIFLSPMDVFIQENFFGAQEQLAFVYDPLGNESGLFAWQRGKPAIREYLIEEDQGVQEADKWNVRVRDATAAATIATNDTSEYGERIQRCETVQKLLTVAVIAVAIISVAWPIVFGLMMRPSVPQPTRPIPQSPSELKHGHPWRDSPRPLRDNPGFEDQHKSATQLPTDNLSPGKSETADPEFHPQPNRATGSAASVSGAQQTVPGVQASSAGHTPGIPVPLLEEQNSNKEPRIKKPSAKQQPPPPAVDVQSSTGNSTGRDVELDPPSDGGSRSLDPPIHVQPSQGNAAAEGSPEILSLPTGLEAP
ncbi:MAG: hypothetical protein K8T91_10780 [Planctomycetes bacterium]|nr:hypothetical protein [Planctomycetota bacterium]